MTFQLGLVTYHLGGVEEAERLGLQALEWLERTGERSWELQTLRTLALCALARSDLELAEERLGQAIPLALEIGGMIVDFYRILVEVLVEQDRLDDANDLARLALTNLPEEDAYARAAGLMIRASIATAEAEHAAADEHYAEVLRLLEQQQLPLDLGEARFAYGRALRRSGNDGRAVAELTRARDDLQRMGAAGLVSQIDRELDQLAQGAGSPAPCHRPNVSALADHGDHVGHRAGAHVIRAVAPVRSGNRVRDSADRAGETIEIRIAARDARLTVDIERRGTQRDDRRSAVAVKVTLPVGTPTSDGSTTDAVKVTGSPNELPAGESVTDVDVGNKGFTIDWSTVPVLPEYVPLPE